MEVYKIIFLVFALIHCQSLCFARYIQYENFMIWQANTNPSSDGELTDESFNNDENTIGAEPYSKGNEEFINSHIHKNTEELLTGYYRNDGRNEELRSDSYYSANGHEELKAEMHNKVNIDTLRIGLYHKSREEVLTDHYRNDEDVLRTDLRNGGSSEGLKAEPYYKNRKDDEVLPAESYNNDNSKELRAEPYLENVEEDTNALNNNIHEVLKVDLYSEANSEKLRAESYHKSRDELLTDHYRNDDDVSIFDSYINNSSEELRFEPYRIHNEKRGVDINQNYSKVLKGKRIVEPKTSDDDVLKAEPYHKDYTEKLRAVRYYKNRDDVITDHYINDEDNINDNSYDGNSDNLERGQRGTEGLTI